MLDHSHWKYVFSLKPTLPLKGALAVNDKLNNAERLFENEIKGPEGLAIYNNELYTTLHNGYVVKLVNGKLVPIIKFGQDCGEKILCLFILMNNCLFKFNVV